jgi:hypothetical protein
MKKLLVLITLALLALAQPVYAGWYLMAPPADLSQVYPDRPITSWQQVSAFDSAYACQAFLVNAVNSFETRSDYEFWRDGNLSRQLTIQRATDSKCIER